MHRKCLVLVIERVSGGLAGWRGGDPRGSWQELDGEMRANAGQFKPPQVLRVRSSRDVTIED